MFNALQAHHEQLQEYLSTWCKRQEQILCASKHAKPESPLEEIACSIASRQHEQDVQAAPQEEGSREGATVRPAEDTVHSDGATHRGASKEVCSKHEQYLSKSSSTLSPGSEGFQRQASATSSLITSSNNPSRSQAFTRRISWHPESDVQDSISFQASENQEVVWNAELLQHLEVALDCLNSLENPQRCKNVEDSNTDVSERTKLTNSMFFLEHAVSQMREYEKNQPLTPLSPFTSIASCHSCPSLVTQFSKASIEERMEASKSGSGILGDQAHIREQASRLFRHKRQRTKGILAWTHSDGGDRLLSKIVGSRRFECVCAAVIFCNAIAMGFSANYAMSHLDNPKNELLQYLETAFFAFYFIEICLRLRVKGKQFFVGPDWTWNWFDMLLIVICAYDQVEALVNRAGESSPVVNLSFLRMWRLLKMVKLLRMFRLMRMFRELRLILNSMLGCMQAMIWASLLVAIIAYMFSICFLHGCTTYLQENRDANPSTREAIEEYWGSVQRAMNSLFISCTGGEDWALLANPLDAVGVVYYLLFVVYIAFFMFVILNTLTSLFVDSVIDHSSRDHQLVIQMEMEKKDMYIGNLQAFFDEIDNDGNGEVTFDEFCHNVHNPKLHAFAASLEIDVSDAKGFFHILSNEGAHPVDVETFVVGCLRMKGQAKSSDLLRMHQKLAHTQRKIDSLSTQMQALEVVVLKSACPSIYASHYDVVSEAMIVESSKFSL